jgi:hypothetical protein
MDLETLQRLRPEAGDVLVLTVEPIDHQRVAAEIEQMPETPGVIWVLLEPGQQLALLHPAEMAAHGWHRMEHPIGDDEDWTELYLAWADGRESATATGSSWACPNCGAQRNGQSRRCWRCEAVNAPFDRTAPLADLVGDYMERLKRGEGFAGPFSGYDNGGPLPADDEPENDEPEIAECDPGPECDDEGGMSEFKYGQAEWHGEFE